METEKGDLCLVLKKEEEERMGRRKEDRIRIAMRRKQDKEEMCVREKNGDENDEDVEEGRQKKGSCLWEGGGEEE